VIARVEPLTRTRAVRGPFDYRLRPEQAGVRVGSLLRVPFGHRTELGIVVELASRSELAPDRLAEPEAVLPAGVPPDLVALAGWMAQEYCSTPARALGLVLAPGATGGARPKWALVAELTADGAEVLNGHAILTERQRAVLQTLARRGPTVAAELGTPALRRLEARGLVSIRRDAVPRRPARHDVAAATASPPALTAEQQRALEPVLEALRARRSPDDGARFLLHGVTGSGKTEVYLRAVQETLRAGRGAIVLVPEIALTPQALIRFEARFGGVVAMMHSGIGRGQRYDEWRRLAGGEAQVCIGPRSAVFAPLPDIGLIIVDEEHEGSFKHEGDPRYDARTVAERRARDHGAVLLLGSATPRPESALSAPRLRLRTRIDGRPLPPVEILDMRGQHHPLHPRTRLALADLRRAGGKAIVLLNRRGWSNFLSCRSCGRVWMCPNCEVALVLHRHRLSEAGRRASRSDREAGCLAGDYVACHHCGHREPAPSRCVSCSSVAVARHGAGTERIEHELADALGDPGFPVLRLDADSAGLDQRARTLERFAAAPAGLLVGTQMVAKGHDFPDVELGIVLDADQTLRFPDFRAEERTFALVTQLAGRAGRGIEPRPPGRVLVQTLAPAARSIQLAARHDSDGFLAGELARRRVLSYPPFSSLIRIVCAAAESGDAARVAAELCAALEPGGASVLGPAPLFRLRGQARSQIVVKAADRATAIGAVGAAVERIARAASKGGVSISVDVDPQ
jgi:primosomal protein N' (replication factor Y) (superfamily II helicase)